MPVRLFSKLKSGSAEQLGQRRKTLHLATLATLREELSRELEVNSQVIGNSGVKRIYDEFDRLIHAHEIVTFEQYGVDPDYKKLTSEAIEIKSMAMLKVEIYVESVKSNCDDAVLERILARPFAEFARQTVVLELRTGIRNFPWKDVAEKNSVVDFGSWSPSGIEASKLDMVVQALADNHNLRTIRVNGHEVSLSGGWESKEINWDRSPAVKSSPVTMALLLRNCRAVTSLSIRYQHRPQSPSPSPCLSGHHSLCQASLSRATKQLMPTPRGRRPPPTQGGGLVYRTMCFEGR